MEKDNKNIILTDISSENITIVDNLDLNTLFNLSYNFDILKGIISTILKNQESLQKQIEKEKKINKEQNKAIETLKNNIISIKEKYTTKELFNSTHSHFVDIKSKIGQIDEKIILMEEELSKSKNIYINIYKYILIF